MIIKGLAWIVLWLCILSIVSVALITFSSIIAMLFPLRIKVPTEAKDNKKLEKLRNTLRTGTDTEVRDALLKYLR